MLRQQGMMFGIRRCECASVTAAIQTLRTSNSCPHRSSQGTGCRSINSCLKEMLGWDILSFLIWMIIFSYLFILSTPPCLLHLSCGNTNTNLKSKQLFQEKTTASKARRAPVLRSALAAKSGFPYARLGMSDAQLHDLETPKHHIQVE